MTHKNLYQLDLDCLMDILNSNHLNVSEMDVLKTIKMWINHDFETREKYFSKLLECVYYDDSLKVRVYPIPQIALIYLATCISCSWILSWTSFCVPA